MNAWSLSQLAENWWVVAYGPNDGPAQVIVAFGSEHLARQFLRLQLAGTHAITWTTAEMLAAGGYYEGGAA